MRILLTAFLVSLVVFTSACTQKVTASGSAPVNADNQGQRFKIIYEHPETKYIGGLTVLRDNATGCEYLIVTGLNGSTVVVPLQGNGGQREYLGPAR